MDLDAPGLGWTGIELLFTVLQCVASVQLLHGVQQGDAKAIEAFNFFNLRSGGLVWFFFVDVK